MLQHPRSVEAVAISSDGSLVVSGSDDCTARVWDASSGNVLQEFQHEGRRCGVSAVAMSHDGATVATGTLDGAVRLWAVRSGQCLSVLTEAYDEFASLVFASEAIETLCFSGDATLLMVSDREDDARLFDVRTGEVLRWFKGAQTTLAGDKGVVCSFRGGAGTGQLWRACAKAELATLALLGPPSLQVRWSRFLLDLDGDHAIWSRVFGFLMWS